MLPMLSALAICLFIAPLIGRVIASRIAAKQRLYVLENRDAIRAAAAAWHVVLREAEPGQTLRRRSKAGVPSFSSPDPADAKLEAGRPVSVR